MEKKHGVLFERQLNIINWRYLPFFSHATEWWWEEGRFFCSHYIKWISFRFSMKDGIGLRLYTWYEHFFLSWGCQWRCTILSLATAIVYIVYIYTHVNYIYSMPILIAYDYISYETYEAQTGSSTSLQKHGLSNILDLLKQTVPFQITYSKTFKNNMFNPCFHSMNHHWRWRLYTNWSHHVSAPHSDAENAPLVGLRWDFLRYPKSQA